MRCINTIYIGAIEFEEGRGRYRVVVYFSGREIYACDGGNLYVAYYNLSALGW